MEDVLETGCHADVINSLPEEILERILSFLSPYGQCKQASLVCRRWHRVIQGVLQQAAQTFQSAAAEGRLQWSYHECPATPLTSRHSHNMCRHGEHVYVFGGCSSSLTAFNDMWKLHLRTREWSRVLALGSYPSPKAASTMVPYKDSLILFGGWAPPVPYPLHQAPHIFNELQVFNIKENRWNLVVTSPSPPPVAGHQACVVGDKMVVFGGMIDPHHKSNDLYEFDLDSMTWRVVNVSDPKPSPRYGHLQYLLGTRHLLVIGGCGISNKTLSDVWVLEMANDNYDWKWKAVEVRNEEDAAPVIFGHPACKVGNNITIFGKSKNPHVSVAMRRSQVIASAPRPAPAGPQIPQQRPPSTNARRELRTHGLLLNGSNKRLPVGGESPNSSLSRRNRPVQQEDMECQPSTSAQGTNASDSQVYDELHGANNTSDAADVTRPATTSGVLTSAGGHVGSGGASSVQSNSGAKAADASSQSANLSSLCNNSPSESRPIKKSNLNQAHTGHLPRRKDISTKSSVSARSFLARNTPSCLCSKQVHSRPSLPKHHMQQYVLNTSEVISSGYVTWQPIKEQDTDHKIVYSPIRAGHLSQHGPPPETCFTSVCEGRAELIMFGGLLEDTCQFSSIGKSAINTVYYAM